MRLKYWLELMFCFLVAFFLANSCKRTVFIKSDNVLSDVISAYYQKKDISVIPKILEFIEKKKINLNEKRGRHLVPFLSRIFRENRQEIPVWLKGYDLKDESYKQVLGMAIWYAETPEGFKILNSTLLKSTGEFREFVASLLLNSPIEITDRELTQAADLDFLWNCFFATGEEKYILKIISTLKWINQGKDSNQIIIGQAANWSLNALGKDHPRVKEICKKAISKSDTATKEILEEIVKTK